jgi:[NiFe] hydrogenase assembly HybE family chaperone
MTEAACWQNDPTAAVNAVFADVAATRMAGLPLNNPALSVEALGFRRLAAEQGAHWLGVLIAPWAINLLILPGSAAWPAAGGDRKCAWQFASGRYEFTAAEQAGIGAYQLCSLYSPAFEFASQDDARATALAVLAALFLSPDGSVPHAAAAIAAERPARRSFLGLGR